MHRRSSVVPLRSVQAACAFLRGHHPLAPGNHWQMLVENRVAHRTPPLDPSSTDFYEQTARKHPSEVGRLP